MDKDTDITNEQLFEFMTKMYGEMQEMKNNMVKLESNMATKHDIVRLEDKMDMNHKALYDGYKQTYEKLTTLENKVDGIDKKVERQDVEIRVIKGAKS